MIKTNKTELRANYFLNTFLSVIALSGGIENTISIMTEQNYAIDQLQKTKIGIVHKREETLHNMSKNIPVYNSRNPESIHKITEHLNNMKSYKKQTDSIDATITENEKNEYTHSNKRLNNKANTNGYSIAMTTVPPLALLIFNSLNLYSFRQRKRGRKKIKKYNTTCNSNAN